MKASGEAGPKRRRKNKQKFVRRFACEKSAINLIRFDWHQASQIDRYFGPISASTNSIEINYPRTNKHTHIAPKRKTNWRQWTFLFIILLPQLLLLLIFHCSNLAFLRTIAQEVMRTFVWMAKGNPWNFLVAVECFNAQQIIWIFYVCQIKFGIVSGRTNGNTLGVPDLVYKMHFNPTQNVVIEIEGTRMNSTLLHESAPRTLTVV